LPSRFEDCEDNGNLEATCFKPSTFSWRFSVGFSINSRSFVSVFSVFCSIFKNRTMLYHQRNITKKNNSYWCKVNFRVAGILYLYWKKPINLTLLGMAFLENLRVTQVFKKFPPFYETQRFSTMFTRAHRQILSWTCWIQTTYTFLSSILISLYLYLHFP